MSAGIALLLQNIAEFPSMSMRRYAGSFSNALRMRGDWTVEKPEVHQSVMLGRLAGEANASRWGRLVRYPHLVRRLRRELRPDIVHVLDHSHANLLRACDPATSIITVHDLIPMLSVIGELNFNVSRAVRYTFPRKLRLIKHCAVVIAISESTRRQLLRFVDMPPERIKVVHYGVSDAFNPAASADEREAVLRQYGIDPSRKVVLHVCTRNRYKNSPVLLRALAKLPDEVVLLRVGADLFEDEQALARELNVTNRVINAGRITGDDRLAACYRTADVFAFPSTFEGFGWPPLEAMACGTPVVSSNAASLPEVVGDAGLQVDPHDHDGLAEALDRVLSSDAERRRLTEASLARAAGFSWSVCAERTAAVYADVQNAIGR